MVFLLLMSFGFVVDNFWILLYIYVVEFIFYKSLKKKKICFWYVFFYCFSMVYKEILL